MLLLHISDIHFKATEVGAPDEPNRALRNDLLQDVKKMRADINRPANAILISGDIAFAGKAVEYDFAFKWLEEELCPAAGCHIENVFVVPGNHDVDRGAEAGPAQAMVRNSLRKLPPNKVNDEICKWMRDPTSANVIFGPIENYNRFAAKFLCALRPYTDKQAQGKSETPPGQPFARRDLTLNDGSTLRLWGFNSALISDQHDAAGLMLIDPAASQIEVEDGVTHLVMCHHPFGWLRNGQSFEDRVNAVAKIQLFGHEHTRRIDEGKRYIRIRAGALQPDRDDSEWKPGYNWIEISVCKHEDSRKLSVRIWARMHEVSQFISIPDPDGRGIWKNHLDLPKLITSPVPIEEEHEEPPSVQVQETAMTQAASPVTVRTVTMKLFKLKEHEQRRVITQLKLDRPGDRDLKDYELAINAVRRSQEEGRLFELNVLLDETLANAGRA